MAPEPLPSGGALILAAGFSRRFGSDKRYHVLPDGRTLLTATVELCAGVFDSVCIVLKAGDGSLAAELEGLPSKPLITLAADAHLGMAHSLAAGIADIADAWQWAAVALGDMPFIRPDTLTKLKTHFEAQNGRRIVQPVFYGRPGHPVIFPGRFFPALSVLTGDAGARKVLEAHPDDLLRLVVEDPGVVEDLDSPPGH